MDVETGYSGIPLFNPKPLNNKKYVLTSCQNKNHQTSHLCISVRRRRRGRRGLVQRSVFEDFKTEKMCFSFFFPPITGQTHGVTKGIQRVTREAESKLDSFYRKQTNRCNRCREKQSRLFTATRLTMIKFKRNVILCKNMIVKWNKSWCRKNAAFLYLAAERKLDYISDEKNKHCRTHAHAKSVKKKVCGEKGGGGGGCNTVQVRPASFLTPCKAGRS